MSCEARASLDGIVVPRHRFLAAVGVDATGTKHVLGLTPAANQNKWVARDPFRLTHLWRSKTRLILPRTRSKAQPTITPIANQIS